MNDEQSAAERLMRAGYLDVSSAVLGEGDEVEVIGPLRDDPTDEWSTMVGEQGAVLMVTMTGVLIDFGRAALTLPHKRLRRL